VKTYGTLTYHPTQPRGMWAIAAQPHVMVRVKRVFGRVHQDRAGAVLVADTAEIARDLQWLLDRHPLGMDGATRAHLEAQADRHRSQEQAVLRILGGQQLHLGMPEPARPARPYQLVAADLAIATGRLLLTDDVGLGKAQPLDSPVLTPSGFAPMGSLRVGAAVIAADGTASVVTGIHPQGEIDCYEVTFSDGAVVECSADHLWRVRHCHGRTRSKATGELNPPYWQVATLRDLINRGLHTSRGQAKWHVPVLAAPDLECGEDRPVDPYLLGALLGDGCLRSHGVSITTADDELAAICAELVPDGVVLKQRAGGRHLHYFARVAGSGPNPLQSALRELGLLGRSSFTKLIPSAYLAAPASARLAVLQGLMDTDGYAMPLEGGNATAIYGTSSKALAEGVRFIAESLGGTTRWSAREKYGAVRYSVTVKLPQPLNPFRLNRKARQWGEGHRSLRPTRAITAVRHIGKKPMQCITIDHPSRLYVTNRFVVTHNSMSGVLVLRAPDALPALVVTLTHLPDQWCDEIAKTLPWLRTHIAARGTAYDPTTRRGVHRQPDVLVLNYAKLAGWADYLAGVVRTVIYDEAQELRHAGSAKYTAAARIADGARFKIGLTASPIYNYGGEMYNVLSVLAPDALGTREEFIREWAAGSMAAANGKIAVRDPAALGAYLRDQGLMLGRTRREVGRELPEVLRIPQTVHADTAALDRLSGDAVEMARLILDQTAAATTRWKVAGELDWRLRQATGVAKAPYVAEFVRLLLDSEPRVVLFGWHRAVYQLWAERLAGFRPVFYTGTESPADKRRNAEAFLSGHSRVLIMSLRAGAGLDGLQEAAHVAVFGELDWSPEVHRQCIGRLHRDGQEEPVLAYFLVAEDGSDPVIAEVLNLKRMQSEPMLDPAGRLFQQVRGTQERVRLLAAAVLRRHGLDASIHGRSA
jgi:hypothetical protein